MAGIHILKLAIGIKAGIIGLGVHAGGFASPSASSQPRCTFADGSSVAGTCLLVDEFNSGSLDTTKWLAEGPTWVGPLGGFAPEVGCVQPSQVTQGSTTGSTGSMILTMAANSRASCPPSWTAGGNYSTTGCGTSCAGSWPPGGNATTYDVAVVSTKTWATKFGHIHHRAKMPGGVGGGFDFTLWGSNCRNSNGVIDALSDIFTGLRTCHWPQRGSTEWDAINFDAWNNSHGLYYTHYVDNSIGTPPTMPQTFFGQTYYGNQAAGPGTISNYTNLLSGAYDFGDLTQAFHDYDFEWGPVGNGAVADGTNQRYYRAWVDGTKVVDVQGNWVSDEDKVPMFWNMDTEAPSSGGVAYIDNFRAWCPAGMTCSN